MEPTRLRRGAIFALLAVSLLIAGCDEGGDAGAQTSPPTSEEGGPDTTGTAPEGSTTTSTDPAGSTTTTAPPELGYESVQGIHTIGDFSGLTSEGLGLWQEMVPGVEDIRLTSSADGAEQPALWLAPAGDGPRPLLVILHSSSAEYRQHAGIPYAMFAAENGWAVIAPQFRGVNDDPESMGSDLAVQDVVDAIDHAVSQDGVDPERVYAVGYSGGGTMALLLAGRHPDKVTAVAAWGPPYDLISFYRESARSGTHYAGDIINACGGDPTDSEEARQDCLHRSPITHLDTAREEAVPVFIAQGIHDSILAPSHGAAAFNQLADPDDRFTEEQLESLARGGVPDDISEPVSAETHFGDGDPAPVLTRQSASAWLTLFDADHEMAYQPTLRWFADDPR